MNSSVTVQRPPLSPIPVATAISPKHIHILNLYDMERRPFPLPPPLLAKAVAIKSKTFKPRKSFYATFSSCDKPTTPNIQNEIDKRWLLKKR